MNEVLQMLFIARGEGVEGEGVCEYDKITVLIFCEQQNPLSF